MGEQCFTRAAVAANPLHALYDTLNVPQIVTAHFTELSTAFPIAVICEVIQQITCQSLARGITYIP